MSLHEMYSPELCMMHYLQLLIALGRLEWWSQDKHYRSSTIAVIAGINLAGDSDQKIMDAVMHVFWRSLNWISYHLQRKKIV